MRTLNLQSLVLSCAMAILLIAPLAAAQEEVKYGFVNIARVITESDEGIAEAAELEEIGSGMEQELSERRRQLEQLVRQYEESADGGDPDSELRQRIERMQRELERDVRQAQSDVDTSRQDRIQAIGNKTVNIVQQFGRQNGYTAIFRTDGGQVVYAAPDADITDRIIQAYNRAHPVE